MWVKWGNPFIAELMVIVWMSCIGGLKTLPWQHILMMIHTIMVIDQVYNHDPCLRKTQERRWIRTLRPSSPSGMNLWLNSLPSLTTLPIDRGGVLRPIIINNIYCIGLSHEGIHNVCVVYE